jgi:hypothetical protein
MNISTVIQTELHVESQFTKTRYPAQMGEVALLLYSTSLGGRMTSAGSIITDSLHSHGEIALVIWQVNTIIRRLAPATINGMQISNFWGRAPLEKEGFYGIRLPIRQPMPKKAAK